MKRFVLLLLLSIMVFAQEEEARRNEKHYTVSFIRAETYKDGSSDERNAYLSGWLDSRTNIGMPYVGTAKGIKAYRDCVKGKTIFQITAIVDKYVNSHPETWNRPASAEADDALEGVCPSLHELLVEEINELNGRH